MNVSEDHVPFRPIAGALSRAANLTTDICERASNVPRTVVLSSEFRDPFLNFLAKFNILFRRTQSGLWPNLWMRKVGRSLAFERVWFKPIERLRQLLSCFPDKVYFR